MRILYVEDNQANVFLVKRVAKGHTIINYIDGEEALRNFDADHPDIVLMDIQLAGRLGGLDVIKKLRADGHTLPIIAVTAYAMVGDRERCLEAGCNEYLAKPLPIPKLIKLFQQYERDIQETASQPKTETPSVPETIIPTIHPESEVKDTTDDSPSTEVESTLKSENTIATTEAESTQPTDDSNDTATSTDEIGDDQDSAQKRNATA